MLRNQKFKYVDEKRSRRKKTQKKIEICQFAEGCILHRNFCCCRNTFEENVNIKSQIGFVFAEITNFDDVIIEIGELHKIAEFVFIISHAV